MQSPLVRFLPWGVGESPSWRQQLRPQPAASGKSLPHLGWEWGGALDGEGGAWAGKRGWSMTRHWRLNCFFAFVVSVLWGFCLALEQRSCLAAKRAPVVSNSPQGPLPRCCLVKKYSFSISQKPCAMAHCRDTGGMGCLGPPPFLRNHLPPLPSDPGNDLQFLEEQETKGLGTRKNGRVRGLLEMKTGDGVVLSPVSF